MDGFGLMLSVAFVFADVTSFILTGLYAVLAVPVMQFSLMFRGMPLSMYEIAEWIAKIYLTTAIYGFLLGLAFAAIAVVTRCKQNWIAMSVSFALLFFVHLTPAMDIPPVWQWKFQVLIGVLSFVTLTTFASWDISRRRYLEAP
jgi:hypothetical protein